MIPADLLSFFYTLGNYTFLARSELGVLGSLKNKV